MAMLKGKHQVMVALMKEVYAIFDSEFRYSPRTCPSNHTGESTLQSNPHHIEPSERGRESKQTNKRSWQGESSTSESGNLKRRRRKKYSAESERPYACPFHKYDPRKYSINHETGALYRSCMGPGFTEIHRVKCVKLHHCKIRLNINRQHLRKVHSVPIQCQRCWLVVPNTQALTLHLNSDVICESRQPQPEGISKEKFDLISIRGISWEKIYEILFPGAFIPSPCESEHVHFLTRLTLQSDFEETVQANEDIAPSSPESQEAQPFEAYARTVLPRMVEAELSPIIDARLGPIEQEMKTQIGDIVRDCLSKLEQDFRQSRETRLGNTVRSPFSHSYMAPVTETGGGVSLNANQSELLAPPINNVSNFYREPPHVSNDGYDHFQTASQLHPNQSSDSGYGSTEPCQCVCHIFTSKSHSLVNGHFN